MMENFNFFTLQFLCLKNIRVFLSTCKTVFDIRESDLFDPYDLFDVKDFGKVSFYFTIYSTIL